MKIKINKEKCIGCGMCAITCGDVFEIIDGKSNIKFDADYQRNENCTKEAIDNCPVSAIEIEDNE